MTSTFSYFERSARRLNPFPSQRREFAERDARIAERLAASAVIDNAVMKRLP